MMPWVGLFPSDVRMPPTSQRWMAALLLLFLVLGIATELDRVQYKRSNHYDDRDNLEIRHDLTPCAFVRS